MEAYGITIFCDDIRFEQFGKTSLIGIYGNELNLYSDFPAILPKLCCFVQIRLRPINITSAKIMVYVPWVEDGVPFITNELAPPTENYTTKISEPLADKDITPLIAINHALVMSPFVLNKEGLLKVRAEVNGEVIKVGVLKIVKSAIPQV
jgi:hypothetical protein